MSAEENINRIMELQKSLKSEQRAYLNRYLSHAPRWVLESMQVVVKEKHTVFIEENTPADSVYILADGIVRAVDYRIQGVAYDYMWFYPVKVLGAMEGFLNIPTYMTTLVTATKCTMLLISKSNYERWIWEDKNALKMEIESMGNYLLEQNRRDRLFLFLQGIDRIVYMFVKNYEQKNREGSLILNVSRQELAERSGFSIKTVNRSVKKMEEEGFIGRDGRSIVVSAEQYHKMKKYLEPIIDQS